MTRLKAHAESHLVKRVGWLRAAVLGANDGILSTASIVSGVAAGGMPRSAILLAGLAGLMAGATSMATGEYVSVSSQADTEQADLAREKREIAHNNQFEHEELAQIYVSRGLDPALAKEVANQLMAHDALGAHARDELGISEITAARPVQAALTSAACFTCGALLPLLVVFFVPPAAILWAVITGSLAALAILGALGAGMGGVKMLRPALRVLLWGALSLGLTTLVGIFFKV
ncbi:MAG: VIT family protein [Alphaproteobacteria bacterium]|nr:VIT family protein [Alphaproteobacteria bacterium]